MTGSISEVSSTSTLRRLSRTQRPTMASESLTMIASEPRWPAGDSSVATSDMGRLRDILVGRGCIGRGCIGGGLIGEAPVGARSLRPAAGERQEDVVQGRHVHREPGDSATPGVDLVQQTADASLSLIHI